ncbi:MAG: HAD hydrolase family protein, partial [Gaiellales bacterium]
TLSNTHAGATTVNAGSGEYLRHAPMPVAVAAEAIEALAEEGYSPNVYVNDEMYVAEHSAESDRYGGFQQIGVRAVGDLVSWLSEPPTKLVAVGDPDHLEAVKRRMRDRFEGRLFVSKSLSYFLEFARHGVTKGSGLDFVADYLGFPTERAVAFGDGENDLELLEHAGYGVAVGDANPELVAVSDCSIPGPEAEGVAQVIELILARS